MNRPTKHTSIDAKTCEQARLSRDARFDGLFFTGVKTTGIYCRPVCPAPAPKPHNIVYYANAAAAAAAGFRPCLRCRPEAAPGSPLHRAGSELLAAALRLIENGALDRAPLAALCERIGIGERHLRRLFAEQLGGSPLDVAATRRLLFAKQLLGETRLPITEVAAASGYASLRRFNAAFLASYGKPPRELRGKRAVYTDGSAVQLRLPYRPPYDFAALVNFHARRALPGVECVEANSYHRTIVVDGEPGSISVTRIADDDALELRIHGVRTSALGVVAARVRRMFDVDADP
ncbi:MAG: Ada metal-binding domain-containing protein, partial [Dokdonella sp.]